MSNSINTQGPPQLFLDKQGDVLTGSLADVIEWFLNYDQRVAVIRHPHVERIFQWKQEESVKSGEDVYQFRNAEDRLAIGIVQAITANPTEGELHDWISQLLNVLDDVAKRSPEPTGWMSRKSPLPSKRQRSCRPCASAESISPAAGSKLSAPRNYASSAGSIKSFTASLMSLR